jgi:hypothetical protein
VKDTGLAGETWRGGVGVLELEPAADIDQVPKLARDSDPVAAASRALGVERLA